MASPANMVLKFSGGLVEISALATLIGGPIAEQLLLGQRGAAGMVWATTSTFGVFHMARASLSAVVPDWLRESLGLHLTAVDDAIGMCIRVDRRRRGKDLSDLREVRAVQVVALPHHRPGTLPTVTGRTVPRVAVEPVDDAVTSTYVLDQRSRLIIDSIMLSTEKGPLPVHEFVADTNLPTTRDWAFLMASSLKLVEIYALWHVGSSTVYWATACPWACTFIGAVLLQSCSLGRDNDKLPRNDIVVGELPSAVSGGGNGKLILGMVSNARRHPLWSIIWSIGAAVGLFSITTIFIAFDREPPLAVYIWVAFQAFFLVMRSIVYHMAGLSVLAHQGMIMSQPWSEASISIRRRVVRLLLGLGRQQNSIHPRTVQVDSYRHDTMSASRIEELFNETQWEFTNVIELPRRTVSAEPEKVEVVAVIGDTVLRSFSWAQSSISNNVELYDSAIAFLKVDGKLLAVPSVRAAVTCKCIRDQHVVPRHAGTCVTCTIFEWVHWVPCIMDGVPTWWHWCGKDTKGEMTAWRMDDAELHRRLADVGEWNLSFRGVQDVRAALEVSRSAAAILLGVLRSCRRV